jgi:malate dehydrogenase (oxaloacetate-decarboxylating)(NADP+)
MPTFTAVTPHDSGAEQAEKRAELRRAALEYHEFPLLGKIVCGHQALTNQRDLALAYLPGAAPLEEIVKGPERTSRHQPGQPGRRHQRHSGYWA